MGELRQAKSMPALFPQCGHYSFMKAIREKKMSATVFTVGHSTRTLKEFIDLLRANGIRQVVDIRTIPRSRHNPQFNRETLSKFLRNRRIGYRHMKDLGGLRHARAHSPNAGWRNLSFRGFADYMQTEQFNLAIDKLVSLARRKPVAIMCAEAVPWRCHRSLIGDALLIRGFEVKNIMGLNKLSDHALTPWARVNGCSITYPSENSKAGAGCAHCGK
jgi:uncharacterized protein (DUF488 family)